LQDHADVVIQLGHKELLGSELQEKLTFLGTSSKTSVQPGKKGSALG
jgi:hypothetical protein